MSRLSITRTITDKNQIHESGSHHVPVKVGGAAIRIESQVVRLSRERTTAAAAAGRVRVGESEARTHNAVDVINLHASKVLRAEHIHEDAQSAGLDHFIV